MNNLSELLSSISSVEKELSLLDGILNHVYIFDKASIELIVRIKIGESYDYDPYFVGGLVCTIDDFTSQGRKETDDSDNIVTVRYVTLEKIKLLFTTINQYILVSAVDPEYPLSQFTRFMELFTNSFKMGYELQNYGDTPDGATVSFQIIKSLISEEYKLHLMVSEKTKLLPYKLQELANDIIDAEILKSPSKEELAEDSNLEYVADSNLLTIPQMDPDKSETKALRMLLEKFESTFSDINSITYIHTSIEGMFEHITQGSISKIIEANILHTVLSMIDTVVNLLDMDEMSRTLDLGDNWIFFSKVSMTSFVYLIVDTEESLELVKPLVERVTSTIKNLFPEENI